MTKLPTPPAVVAVCSDHAGYQLKQTIIRRLTNLGYEVKDFGTDSEASCDYPDFAHPCAKAIEDDQAAFGVAMCGSGNGIAMTLNKHQAIRAAICWTPELARLARAHKNANVLVLPARFIEPSLGLEMLDVFSAEPFEGGRHDRRIAKIPVAQ